MPVVGLEAWFAQIPPVTRTWLALSVLTSVAVVRPLYEPFPRVVLYSNVADACARSLLLHVAMSIDHPLATLL